MAARRSRASGHYAKLRALDGRHPYRRAAPDAYVDYPARRRRDGEVAYFNFELAREMGLVPESHPDRLPASLRRAILDSFSLRIINEYDQQQKLRVQKRDLTP